MPQTTQDMRARLQANAQSPLYDGNYANGNRPYMLASGTLGHGQPLTITANNFTFGTKTHNSPHLWETFQNGTHGVPINTTDSTWNIYGGNGAEVSTNYARYLGAKSVMNTSNPSNGFDTNYKVHTPGRKIYSSHWAYVATRGSDTGTLTSCTPSTMTCSGKNWVTNNWNDYVVKITAGTGSADALNHLQILSNTNDTITFDMEKSGGWWTYSTFSTGAAAGVDVPYTVQAGSEVSVDSSGSGDGYGAWSTNNGVIRIGYRIRVRSMVAGASGVVKVGPDVNNPLLTVTAVYPDTTSVFKIVPHAQLKQSRHNWSGASDGVRHYNATGTHGISSWHFHNDNNSDVTIFYGNPGPGYSVKSVTCPVNEWYRVETTIYLSDANVSNGSFSVKITKMDGTTSTVTYTNVMTRSTGQTFLLDEYLIGVMFANVITKTLEAYTSDIYLESDTWKRIEIGNHPVYSQCTIREPQPFTNWSADSVTITQNVASISGPKYVFFIDDNNSSTLVRSLGI